MRTYRSSTAYFELTRLEIHELVDFVNTQGFKFKGGNAFLRHYMESANEDDVVIFFWEKPQDGVVGIAGVITDPFEGDDEGFAINIKTMINAIEQVAFKKGYEKKEEELLILQ